MPKMEESEVAEALQSQGWAEDAWGNQRKGDTRAIILKNVVRFEERSAFRVWKRVKSIPRSQFRMRYGKPIIPEI